MSRNITILIYLDTQERWLFFKRLSKPLKEIGIKIVYLTIRPSIFIQARLCNELIYLALREKKSNVTITLEKDCDVLSGKLSVKKAQILYLGCMKTLEKMGKNLNVDMAFLWNGSSSANMAIINWTKEKNIKCCFFEIANIPGKIFVDPEGVNAKSKLSRIPEILDNLNDDILEYEFWRVSYLKNKFRKNVIVAQSKNLRKFNLGAIIDGPLSLYITCPFENAPVSNFLKKIRHLIVKFDYDDFCIPDTRYIFLPLQVSSDSQVLINSDISLEESIVYAAELAKKNRMKLVIKPHPAEPNIAFIEKVLTLKKKYKFLFSNENIFNLMNNAEFVITINSTAGLEAMILGKKVIVLGQTFYKKFNQKRLRQYINDYLVNIDYFSNCNIEYNKEIEKILLRAKV